MHLEVGTLTGRQSV